mmetsp:Transcript_15074/g.19934  ORF Transcript_15074/g.19934 Transcript_15074/m.19934 type:complete len:153 (-) Transcript_15074:1637-2095(-)
MPRGKRSVRLQSLRENQEGPAKLPLHMDFVRASRQLKPRKWIKKPKVFGSDCGRGFSVPIWQPLDQPKPTPALLAIKDRPPPSVKKLKRKRQQEDQDVNENTSQQQAPTLEDILGGIQPATNTASSTSSNQHQLQSLFPSSTTTNLPNSSSC